MIADLSPVIDNLFMKNYTYSVYSESNSQGEVTGSYTIPVALRCAVLPMVGKELKTLPDGQYTMEDKIILAAASATLKVKDQIQANGISYEIKNEFDVSDLVGIKKYIARKVVLT